MNDASWVELVVAIARRECSDIHIKKAESYLWASENWERLKDTDHGIFLCEIVSPCPDLALRWMYRESVLEGATK